MAIKQLIICTLLLFWLTPNFAQHIHNDRCGHDILMNALQANHPEIAQSINETYQSALQSGTSSGRENLKINVVVHIVWKNPEENLSEELIQQQIDILNADFNRQNEDAGNLRSIFEEVAGEANIEFVLAGVERVQTTEDFAVSLLGADVLPKVKYTDQGGSSAWDTEKYLNIWVCHIQPLVIFGVPLGQILGFAFPPTGLPNWPAEANAPTASDDGVVIDFRVFGKDNPNPIVVPGTTENLIVAGRTPVHEVGHYLGLRHIWGDGGTFGANDCLQSDGIDDTPFANAQSNFDCDLTKNTCFGIDPFWGLDMPDLIENYMDYSSETCMNMFTKGQVELMRNVLMGPRKGLIEGSSNVDLSYGEKMNWSLYPNPAVNQVTLAWEEELDQNAIVEMIALDGRSIWQGILPARSKSWVIPLGNFAPGMYLIRCTTADFSTQQKLMVRGR